MVPIFDTNSEPNVSRVVNRRKLCVNQAFHPLWTFRKDLIRVPIRRQHHVKGSENEVIWHSVLKEIAHRIDKYLSRPNPGQRLNKLLWNQSEVETELVWVSEDTAPPLREDFRVAVLAAWANFSTASDGIPCCVRPFDGTRIAHIGLHSNI